MTTLTYYENAIIQWADARDITRFGTFDGQFRKLVEEVGELGAAYGKGDKDSLRDALGDVFVCLVMCSAMVDEPLVAAVGQAYEEIKDRKGRMTPQGVFVKDPVAPDPELF